MSAKLHLARSAISISLVRSEQPHCRRGQVMAPARFHVPAVHAVFLPVWCIALVRCFCAPLSGDPTIHGLGAPLLLALPSPAPSFRVQPARGQAVLSPSARARLARASVAAGTREPTVARVRGPRSARAPGTR